MDSSSFGRSNLSQRTLYEFMRNQGVSTNPVRRQLGGVTSRPTIGQRPHPSRARQWLPPIRQEGPSALQRLAMEGRQTGPYIPRRPNGGAPRREIVDRGGPTKREIVDCDRTPKKESTEEATSAPPMFEAPPPRRGTRLSHMKGSSPGQLRRLRRIASGGGMDAKKILTIDDLHKAVLAVDFSSIELLDQCELEPPQLTYASLEEYQSRQSRVLLVETLEGLAESVARGFSKISKKSSNSSLYTTEDVHVTAAVRNGRDWCVLTLKREELGGDPKRREIDVSPPAITSGDVVLLFKQGSDNSSVLDQVLQCGLTGMSASDLRGVLYGIAQPNKIGLKSGEPKSIQMRCAWASKDAPLGYSPSDCGVGSQWTALVVHSLLTVEREWRAVCALEVGGRFVKDLLGGGGGVVGGGVVGSAGGCENYSHPVCSRSDSQSLSALPPPPTPPTGLNSYQISALRAVASSSPIVLIQGPPGTGKTHTLIALMRNLRGRVIVCAPSNAAVDELMVRFAPGNMLRVGRNCREELQPFSLEAQVQESFSQQQTARYEQYQAKKAQMLSDIGRLGNEIAAAASVDRKGELVRARERLKGSLTALREKEESVVRVERDTVYRRLLKSARFIFGTLSAFGSDSVWDNLEPGSIDVCIVDEAAQAIEVSTLIPLKFKPKQLVLVGDPQQLPAVVKSARAKEANFGLSLMERLQLVGGRQTILLREQYRMGCEIVWFPSKMFYENQLVTSQSVLARPPLQWAPTVPSWLRRHPLLFIHVPDSSDIRSGTSMMNPREARVTSEIVRAAAASPSSVGVITPYRQQVSLLRSLLPSEVLVDSVDAFQGREKDIIVFNSVRSTGNSVGFLADQRRLNVAITRARHALWIVGNADYLELCGGVVWAQLVKHCRVTGCLVDSEELMNEGLAKRVRRE